MTFDPNQHPRGEHGKFSTTGMSKEDRLRAGQERWRNPEDFKKDIPDFTSETPAGFGADTHLDPRVAETGGDAWNKETADRLEDEYSQVRPHIDQMAHDAEGQSINVKGNPTDVWTKLSPGDQKKAQSAYVDSQFQAKFAQMEKEWHSSGNDVVDAFDKLVKNDGFKASAFAAAYNGIKDDPKYATEPPIPYSLKEVIDKATIEHDGVFFRNIDKLTDGQRDYLSQNILSSYKKTAVSDAAKMMPPEYLEKAASDALNGAWNHMDDGQRLSWAEKHTDVVKTKMGKMISDDFDPLQEMSGVPEAYADTQRLAHYLSTNRAEEVLKERGIKSQATTDAPGAKVSHNDEEDWWQISIPGVPKEEYPTYKTKADAEADSHKTMSLGTDGVWHDNPSGMPTAKNIQDADERLWGGWKGSSTGYDGQILQAAAADEFGGRIRDDAAIAREGSNPVFSAPKNGIVTDAHGKTVDLNDPLITNGEWVELKNGTLIEKYDDSKWGDMAAGDKGWRFIGTPKESVPMLTGEKLKDGEQPWTKLPDVSFSRNGLSSWTLQKNVANDWLGTSNNAPTGIDMKKAKQSADTRYADIGGFDGVKAMLRAKWETTQYLLDRANIPKVEGFRAVMYDHTTQDSKKSEPGKPGGDGMAIGWAASIKNPETGKWTKKIDIPGVLDPAYKTQVAAKGPAYWQKTLASGEAKAAKNGDATISHLGHPSFEIYTPDEDKILEDKYGSLFGAQNHLKNGGRDITARVVLRSSVPRTAVLSVPAFGQNMHGEREYTLLGTAWHNWDAWSRAAPEFDRVPMKDRPESDFKPTPVETTPAPNPLPYGDPYEVPYKAKKVKK